MTNQRTRIYKYRGYLITPTDGGLWWIHSTYFGRECKTLSECRNYINSKLG